MNFSKIRIPMLMGVILLIAIIIQVLYDPVASVKHMLMVSNVRAELPQARAQWDALEITNYTFEIQGDGRSICKPYATIEVREGVVVKVETKDPVGILSPEYWADPSWGEEVFLCSYFHYTMPQIYDLVAQTLRNFPSSIMDADFDPRYGFVARFRFGIYVGYGMLRPEIGQCCNDFRITNFQPLTNQ
jgi:hypothetical protein